MQQKKIQKKAAGADKFAEKFDLANLKSNAEKLDIDKLINIPINLSNLARKVDKLHVDKLGPIPIDLNKISDVVKHDFIKKMLGS